MYQKTLLFIALSCSALSYKAICRRSVDTTLKSIEVELAEHILGDNSIHVPTKVVTIGVSVQPVETKIDLSDHTSTQATQDESAATVSIPENLKASSDLSSYTVEYDEDDDDEDFQMTPEEEAQFFSALQNPENFLAAFQNMFSPNVASGAQSDLTLSHDELRQNAGFSQSPPLTLNSH